MAKKKKKRSAVVPVLKFVGLVAGGAVIGHYATKAWIKHFDPSSRRGGSDEDLEPVENPSTMQGFVQPMQQMPQMQQMPMMPQMPTVLPFPQFMPMLTPVGVPTAMPAAAPAAAAPAAAVLSRAEQMKRRRAMRERDSDAALERIRAELDDWYGLPA